ncbi:HTH_Tnp_Tc3_2 domain-containing protein [Trichonephila clavipes]|nr:HTH_Tnp_Tc3_2 domain-containing protein [Trichonephila clavipes]
MGRSDAAIRRSWQEWVDSARFQLPVGSGPPRFTTDGEDRFTIRSAVTEPDSSLSTIKRWNHADWGRIVFSDEFRFQLRPDDHRRRVWRGRAAFPIARPQALKQELWSRVLFLLTAEFL